MMKKKGYSLFFLGKYNLYLKKLFKEVGLNRPVTRFNQKTGQTEVVLLYSLATSHMARRTFVGTLYKKVKDDVIGAMSGHVKGSKAFARYYDIGEEMKQEAIDLLGWKAYKYSSRGLNCDIFVTGNLLPPLMTFVINSSHSISVNMLFLKAL